jgi:uncharacterized protein YxjI
MKFPLKLSFKVLAVATQIYVEDAAGKPIFYVKQKLFKLIEDIGVFSNDSQRDQRFTIKADRVFDVGASYAFTDGTGGRLGSIKHQWLKSMLKASYQICDGNDNVVMTVVEENPWARVIEGLASEIPVVGVVVNYLVNPSYAVMLANGKKAFRLVKKPSIFERQFEIEKVTRVDGTDQDRAILGLLMMVLLERKRG